MHLLRCLLTLLSFTAHAAGASDMAQISALDKKFNEVEKTRMMQLATEGVSERAALTTIGAYFSTTADQAYLKAKWAKPSDQVLKVRSITEIADGVSVTMPNGRSFTATKDKQGRLLINRQVVSNQSAEKFFSELNRALKTTFVTQNSWFQLLRPQEAQAQVGVTEVLILVGLIGLGIAGPWLREKNLSKLPNAEATAEIWANSCIADKSELKVPYQHSNSAKLSRAIEKNTDLGKLLRTSPVDCVKVADGIANSGASSRIVGDYAKVCEHMMKFAACDKEYQAASAAKFEKAVATPASTSEVSH